MSRRAALVGLVAGLVLAGCGGAPPAVPPAAPPPASTGSPLPARPVELRLDGVAVCSLLTDVQVRALGVNQGQFRADSFGGPTAGDSCDWSNFPGKPDNAYTAGLVTRNGAELIYGREPLRTVGGFAATTTKSLGAPASHQCMLLVDVAPGQALQAIYDNGRKDYPGMNHTLACDKAQELATMMLANLRAQLNR